MFHEVTVKVLTKKKHNYGKQTNLINYEPVISSEVYAKNFGSFTRGQINVGPFVRCFWVSNKLLVPVSHINPLKPELKSGDPKQRIRHSGNWYTVLK